MKSVKRNISIFLLTLCVVLNAFSQDASNNQRFSASFAYAPYHTDLFVGKGFGYEKKKVANYKIGVDYKILNSVDIGTYIAYSYYKSHMNNHFIPFGVALKLHLLPLFYKERKTRFTIYFTGNSGVNYHINSIMNYSEFEYGLGGGLGYMPTKHLRVFFEYLRGQYFFEDNKKVNLGVSFHFNSSPKSTQ